MRPVADFPAIRPAVGVNAGRKHHVAAPSPYVNSIWQFARTIAQARPFRLRKQQMGTALAGQIRDGLLIFRSEEGGAREGLLVSVQIKRQ